MNQKDDRKTCNLCNRKFNSNRLEKHIEVCKKQKEKKRNVFDSSKQRQIIDEFKESNESKHRMIIKTKAKIVKPVTKMSQEKASFVKKTEDKKNSEDALLNDKKMTKDYSDPTNEYSSVKKTSLTNIANKNNHLNGGNYDLIDNKSRNLEKNDTFIESNKLVQKEKEIEFFEETDNKHESIDKDYILVRNSESYNTTTINAYSNDNTSNVMNEKSEDTNTKNKKSKSIKCKIRPPQATKLNKTNELESKNSAVTNTNQSVMNRNSNATTNSDNNSHHTIINKKSINAFIKCTICGRSFNQAAGDRHIPFCAEKERKRKNLTNLSNEEALARFRLRNAYRFNQTKKRDKSVPNVKKDACTEKLSIKRALSTIDGLNKTFNKEEAPNQFNKTKKLTLKPSISQGNLNQTTSKRYANMNLSVKKIQPTNQSKSSSASSKSSLQRHNNLSIGFKEQAQSRVKARLNQQQKIQKQRMNSNFPKTPIMKFKEKFPNHNNKLMEFSDSQKFSLMLKKHLDNSFELNNAPKTVPGVRTGGLSPTKDLYADKNEHYNKDINDLEQLRARIKEMYLSSNNNHSQNDYLNLDYPFINNEFNNENSLTRENSSSKIKSKSVNDFLAVNESFNDVFNDIDLPKTCYTCSTNYITMSARYCFNCGARRY